MNKFNFILFVLISSLSLKANLLPYISPGISLAWSPHKALYFGWKVSIGGAEFNNSNKLDGYFINLTIGYKLNTIEYSINNSYWYTEIESGIITGMLLSGIGIGASYWRKKNNKIYIAPKGSIFTGDIVFLRSDFTVIQKKFLYDIGGIFVIPFNKYMFESYGLDLHNISD